MRHNDMGCWAKFGMLRRSLTRKGEDIVDSIGRETEELRRWVEVVEVHRAR